MLMRLLFKFAISALAVYLIAKYIPGIHVTNNQTILIVALVWSLITMFIRPVLKILTFPITLVTLGLFSFILNAILFFSMTFVVGGFHVDGFIPALIGSIILSFISSLAEHHIIKR
jgi:putative membrane protein